jgi:hypothetical protein
MNVKTASPYAVLVALVILTTVMAGCVQPVQKLGCCLKENATSEDPASRGCMLYNTTDYKVYDYKAQTKGLCDHEAATPNEIDTQGLCNVTIQVGAGTQDFLIPICTQDDIVKCIDGNCTAMVCGDFVFRPRVAPGFSNTAKEDTGTDASQAKASVSGAVPAETKGSTAMQFYKAQCRFLPMDAKLRGIMKNSKSQINVFRLGVGGSFDEFDQYRYYFPISDKYCSVNQPAQPGQKLVDRYMNYLTTDAQGRSVAYNDPVGGITANCVDDSTTVPAPLAFTENADLRMGAGGSEYDYTPVVPDKSNYKFAHSEITGRWAYSVLKSWEYIGYTVTLDEAPWKTGEDCGNWPDNACKDGNVYSDCSAAQYLSAHCPDDTCIQEFTGDTPPHVITKCTGPDYNCWYKLSFCAVMFGKPTSLSYAPALKAVYGYSFGGGYPSGTNGIFKKIDSGYYRKWLSIAHAGTIYDIGGTGTTRAPFECNSEGNECYSGSCSTTTYSRGVMLGYEDGGNPMDAPDVVTDCDKFTDDAGMAKVVCAPTKSVTLQDGKQPARAYGQVTIRPILLQYNADGNYKDAPVGAGDLSEEDALDDYWTNFYSYSYPLANGMHAMPGISRTVTNATYVEWRPTTLKKDCAWENYGPDIGDNDQVWCDHVSEAGNGPALGGITFFGKPGDDTVFYPATGKTIIGWSNLEPSDFRDTLLFKNCNLKPGDYDVVNLYGMDDSAGSTMGGLLAAFKPYFEARVQSLKTGLGSGRTNKYSIVYSSMPWVSTLERGVRRVHHGSEDCGECNTPWQHYSYFLASPPSDAIRDRNIYDEDMASIPDSSATSLIAGNGLWDGDEKDDDDKDKWVYSTYALGLSTNFILINYEPGSGKLGNCAIDDSTMLPRVRNYGWCEACTTSTLALQNVTAFVQAGPAKNREVYMPTYTGNVEKTVGNSGKYTYTNSEPICDNQNPTVSCFNRHITDMQEYNGPMDSFGTRGSPRTKPDAAILKERLGNYMKSGILPVLDLSDASNWDRKNHMADNAPDYTEYDFQRLIGSMGATLVIVDHVSGPVDADAKLERIIDRSGIIRDRCSACLTAFHVDAPATNASLRDAIGAVLSDPRANFNIDMVTFDYSVSQHPQPSAIGLVNKSGAVVDDIASYGRASLMSGGKPTMVVGFSVDNGDAEWNGNYGMLFDAVVQKQGELVKAGVTGIIYSPVRGGSEGLISVPNNGVGLKTDKFCAFEGAMQKASTSPPVAVFQRILAQDVACVACSSLDYLDGTCNLASQAAQLQCDDGRPCQVPNGMNQGKVKCPAGAITADCGPCTSSTKSYTCTYKYVNGTVSSVGPRPISELTGDIYSDIIAGLPRPEKCCITDPDSGARVSYTKQAYPNPINKPLVFPKVGDPNIDCGMGSGSDALAKLGSFCGYSLPLKQYDITCTVSG